MWSIEFFKDNREMSPVEDFINGPDIQSSELAKIIFYLDLLRETGILLGMPYAREVVNHKPLWELRPKGIRLFYFLTKGQKFIILHGCRKKSNKAKKKDIRIAENRMTEFLEREND